jgi:hypothetical protein
MEKEVERERFEKFLSLNEMERESEKEREREAGEMDSGVERGHAGCPRMSAGGGRALVVVAARRWRRTGGFGGVQAPIVGRGTVLITALGSGPNCGEPV